MVPVDRLQASPFPASSLFHGRAPELTLAILPKGASTMAGLARVASDEGTRGPGGTRADPDPCRAWGPVPGTRAGHHSEREQPPGRT